MAVLLVVASQAGEAIQPTASEFHQLLATLLNIDSPPRGLLTEAKLEEGDVVTTLADLDRVVYSDWRDAVIAFGSKQGVCILLLKADPERASPNLPDAPNWLSDGLTTVDENQRAEE
jgi:hypothetical protein